MPRWLVPFALLFVALGLSVAGWQRLRQGEASPLDNGLSRALVPLQTATSSTGTLATDTWQTLTRGPELAEENRRLKAQSEETAMLRQRVAALEGDNHRLQALLGLAQQTSCQTLAARVVARDPTNWFATVTLDVGSRDGVRKDQVVVCPSGVVGQIAFVNDASSRVRLLTDARSAVPCAVGPNHALGVLYGTDGPTCDMRYVDADAVLHVQETAVTSGLGEVFPAGLVLGTLVDSQGLHDGLFKTAQIKPAATLSSVSEVLVLLR